MAGHYYCFYTKDGDISLTKIAKAVFSTGALSSYTKESPAKFHAPLNSLVEDGT